MLTTAASELVDQAEPNQQSATSIFQKSKPYEYGFAGRDRQCAIDGHCYNYISNSPKLLEIPLKYNIPILYYSKYGNFHARLWKTADVSLSECVIEQTN